MSCQSPVNPGFTCSLIVPLRVLIHDKRHLRSRATSDMLPCKTFSSCGNSSRLVRRRIVPTLVILESSEVPKNHMEMHGCAWFGICAVPTTSAQRKALYSSLRLFHTSCRRSNHSDFGAWASSVGPFAGKSSSRSDSTSWIAVLCFKVSTQPLEITVFAAHGRTNLLPILFRSRASQILTCVSGLQCP